MYTSSKDGSIIKWDLHTGRKAHIFYKARPPKILGKGKGKAPADPLSHVDGHTDEVWALALSPDGRLLASGGKDRRVGVWDVEKNEWVKGFSGHRDSISVRFSIPHRSIPGEGSILTCFLYLCSSTCRPWRFGKRHLFKLPLPRSNYTPAPSTGLSSYSIYHPERWDTWRLYSDTRHLFFR